MEDSVKTDLKKTTLLERVLGRDQFGKPFDANEYTAAKPVL